MNYFSEIHAFISYIGTIHEPTLTREGDQFYLQSDGEYIATYDPFYRDQPPKGKGRVCQNYERDYLKMFLLLNIPQYCPHCGMKLYRDRTVTHCMIHDDIFINLEYTSV